MKRTRENLIRVGIFVLMAGALLAGGLLWIAGTRLFRPVDRYTVLFEDSVTGLNAGANVEYQGVVVGRVRDIQLTGDLPPKVAVIADIEPGTPIRTDTVAALLGSLVTGIKYIQLQGGSPRSDPLLPGGTIRGDVTSLEQFRDQIQQVADRAVNILRRLDEEVFTTVNSHRVSAFLADLTKVAQSLGSTFETFRAEQTGKDVSQLVRQLNEIAGRLNVIVTDFDSRREGIYGDFASTLRHLDETVRETRSLVRSANEQIGGTSTSVGGLLGELTATVNRLQETIDVIRSNPSVLLWGRSLPERELEQ
jgi:phospholipid/cholesterol/gamma-HCH transport system substrate-binding protein